MRRLAPIVWLTFLALVFILLSRMSFSLTGWATSPVDAFFAVIRLGGMAASAYLFACAVLAFAGSQLNSPTVARFSNLVAVSSIRRFQNQLIAASLVGALGSPSVVSASTFENAPVLHNVGGSVGTPVLDPVETAPVVEPVSVAVHDKARTHTVTTGENFWTIAESELTRTGQLVTDAAIAAYWQQLVDANGDRLINNKNPDMLFSGQQLTLPDPSRR